MLAIRLQRRGRKGLAQYRVIVQDSHRSPKSGRVVAQLGSYDPHAKVTQLDTEKAAFYLKNGAQPSDRVARIFKAEKIALPDWVKDPTKKDSNTRNPEKLRKNQPAEEAPAEEPAAEEVAEAPAEEKPAEETKEAPAEEKVAEAPKEEAKEAEPSKEAAEEKPSEEKA